MMVTMISMSKFPKFGQFVLSVEKAIIDSEGKESSVGIIWKLLIFSYYS
jgi:hypothetical protein